MKKNRVECDLCESFIPPVFKEDNLFAKIKENAKCKKGKRVMFRQPTFSRLTAYVPNNDFGYIRFCNDFKK